MTTKLILFLLIFAASCGEKQVTFPTNPQAISNTYVTNAEQAKLQQQGVFHKQSTLNGSTLVTGGKSYPFSEYSSNQALTWYSSKPNGSATNVLFRGEVKNGKIIVEVIQDQ
jgi:hypothetical protein